jgi:ubiquinone/menaquinone biosynthesis C-methylase UbiE
MSARREAIELYLKLGMPKRLGVLTKLICSIKGQWLIPLAFSFFFLFKKSTMGKYFFLDKRVWIRKSYNYKDLAPFHRGTGDLPLSELQGSLEDLVLYAKRQLNSNQSKSISTIKYWMLQKEMPPLIVVSPSLSRSPYANTKGCIVDGNHRAIAMALKNEPIRSYTGVLIKKKDKKPDSSHKIKYANKYRRSSIVRTYNHGITSLGDRLITSKEIGFISAAMQKAGLPDKITSLDVATGTGRIIGQLERNDRTSIGLDTSKTMIDFAKKNTKLANFANGDSGNIPFKSNSFDIVTCFRLFINLSKNDRQKFLCECRRVMREDGILVLDNHCNKFSLTGLLGNIRKRFVTSSDDPYKLYSLLTEYQFLTELRTAGFTNCRKMYSFLPAISQFRRISASTLERIDQCLVKIPILNPFADLITVALEK